ncbi:MAG: hypothetical protein LN573_00155 [Rickettsia endosymbiont of Oxypoda opaca]|nr:hypothetical protein [Rickettsia endosymbiont of Oxypoda opaca]
MWIVKNIFNVTLNCGERCCMAREINKNPVMAKPRSGCDYPENHSHPEFISGYFSRDAETSSA